MADNKPKTDNAEGFKPHPGQPAGQPGSHPNNHAENKTANTERPDAATDKRKDDQSDAPQGQQPTRTSTLDNVKG